MRRLHEIFEGDERAAGEFLTSALSDLLRLIERLEKPLTVSQRLAAAHELKGAAGNVGAVEISHIAGELENELRSGACDVPSYAMRLKNAYERARMLCPLEYET
jgi:HPt (histidine-containing phosphotransfer) domain-containing protein